MKKEECKMSLNNFPYELHIEINILLQSISYICFYFFFNVPSENFKYVAPMTFLWDSADLEGFSLNYVIHITFYKITS